MCAPHMRVWGHTGGRVLSMISIVVFFPTDIQSLSSDRFSQEYGIGCEGIFAPVAKMTALSSVIAITAVRQ